jgi:3-oxoacyl-[acyl-carrier protein] reductase
MEPFRAQSRELEGQHAVITGGARGVGEQVALTLAAAGAQVSLRDLLDTAPAVAAVTAAGGKATGFKVDVTDRAAVHATIEKAAATAGGIDVLVCNAGVYGKTTRLDDLDEAELAHVLGVNVGGTLWTAQAAVPYLRKRKGRIVLIGSAAGRVGGVLAGPHYSASKGAVHTLVRWLAKAEAKHGIRANGVAPGAVATDMIAGKGYSPEYCPLGRIAEPSEIAGVVHFLATSGSSYMTGAVVDANGGYSFS